MDSVLRGVVLGLLAIDGVISAVLGSMFVLAYVGPVPFPISALISGLMNAALLWVGLQWTSSPLLASLPVFTWLLALAVMMVFGGLGGDALYGTAGSPTIDQLSSLVLLVFGAVPPWILLRRVRRRRR